MRLLFAIFCLAFNAYAEDFTISRAKNEKDEVLILSPKINTEIAIQEYANSVVSIIRSTIDKTSFLKSVDEKTPQFIEGVSKNHNVPQDAAVESILNDVTLVMQSARMASINYVVDFHFDEARGKKYVRYDLWDALSENRLRTHYFSLDGNSPDKIAKYIAHSMHVDITQEYGFIIGQSIISSRPRGEYQALSMFDGAQYKMLTNDHNLITSPRICDNGNKVFFAMKNADSNYGKIYSIASGRIKSVDIPEFNNVTLSAPAVSDNCNIVAFSASYNGKSSIFMTDVVNHRSYACVNNGAINTYPKFSSDMDKVFYISDVTGSPKIWVVDIDGKNAHILSRGFGAYLAYDVRGDKIAFVKVLDGKFVLGIMDIEGKKEKVLKKAYLIEAPVFAPVGNNIIVSIRESSGSAPKLYSVSSFTGNSYEVFSGSALQTRSESNIINSLWFVPEHQIPKDITDEILFPAGGAQNLLHEV